MDTTSIIGVVASVLTGISMLPQLLKLIKEKKSEGISLWMLSVLCIGLGCWVWYGCLKTDWIIIISNTFSLLINLTTAALSLKYKDKS
jgi:MtN3 and saliva related transmembrane protein